MAEEITYLWSTRATSRYHRAPEKHPNSSWSKCSTYLNASSTVLSQVPSRLTPCGKCFPKAKMETMIHQIMALPAHEHNDHLFVRREDVLAIVCGEELVGEIGFFLAVREFLGSARK